MYDFWNNVRAPWWPGQQPTLEPHYYLRARMRRDLKRRLRRIGAPCPNQNEITDRELVELCRFSFTFRRTRRNLP